MRIPTVTLFTGTDRTNGRWRYAGISTSNFRGVRSYAKAFASLNVGQVESQGLVLEVRPFRGSSSKDPYFNIKLTHERKDAQRNLVTKILFEGNFNVD